MHWKQTLCCVIIIMSYTNILFWNRNCHPLLLVLMSLKSLNCIFLETVNCISAKFCLKWPWTKNWLVIEQNCEIWNSGTQQLYRWPLTLSWCHFNVIHLTCLTRPTTKTGVHRTKIEWNVAWDTTYMHMI